jgi:(p)ppGpp synthase/HD superfamily hydrolase
MNDIVAFMRAADFAAHKHVGQRRKGEEAEPYLNHLIEVVSLVAEATDGDPDAVIAALLHDAVEDQGVTVAEIADLFGPTAASLVAEVTDDKNLPKQVRKDSRSSARHTRATAQRLSSSPTRPATWSRSLKAHRRGPRSGNGPMSNGREPSCRAYRSNQRG